MARLLDTTIEDVQAHRLAVARDFAADASRPRRAQGPPHGHRRARRPAFINLTGNPGMATGGTGDVLTGMIAAWFAQLLDAEAACKLAVYLHGPAGDLAEADEGEVALDRRRHRRRASATRCSS